MFINFGEKESDNCLYLSGILRKHGIFCEIYPESAKLKKQMKYANDRKFPFVVLIGGQEMENSTCVIKNMNTGNQQTIKMEELVNYLS